jgi:hypothetical protein
MLPFPRPATSRSPTRSLVRITSGSGSEGDWSCRPERPFLRMDGGDNERRARLQYGLLGHPNRTSGPHPSGRTFRVPIVLSLLHRPGWQSREHAYDVSAVRLRAPMNSQDRSKFPASAAPEVPPPTAISLLPRDVTQAQVSVHCLFGGTCCPLPSPQTQGRYPRPLPSGTSLLAVSADFFLT